MSLEQYKDLFRQYDNLQRLKREDDVLGEQMEDLWWKLTEEEKDEVRKLSCELHEAWSPQERYEEALEVIENIKWMIPAGPNDRTPFEARLAQRAHWEERRDLAKSQMVNNGRSD